MIRRLAGRVLGFGLRLVAVLAVVLMVWVGAYRWLDPPVTWLIATERARLGQVEQTWTGLTEMSAHLPRAAMAAEDARFCAHFGFDLREIRKALDAGAARGASTISQQVAKNVFLWPDRSWIRKGAEAGLTLLIEALWPKRRIMEVYLNVAEFGEGVFGAEAGAQASFRKPARALTLNEASRLVAVLPNPKGRDARKQVRRGARVADGAATLAANGGAACIAPD